MYYCRKCGARLDEGARFCRLCGTPTVAAAQPKHTPVIQRSRSSALPLLISVVAAIAIVGFLLAFLFFVPVNDVDFADSKSIPKSGAVDMIKLDFEADIAQVNVVCTDLPDDFVRVDVTAQGSTGFLGSSEPVELSLSSQTSSGVLTVTSEVSRSETWLSSFALDVTCNVYVDASAVVDLDVQNTVGTITLSADAPVTFEDLSLQTQTGTVEADLLDTVFVNGDISIETTTGRVNFVWNNIHVSPTSEVKLGSTTGSVTASVLHSRDLSGNVSFNAKTTTGRVNLNLNISGQVGAQITSDTDVGSINVDSTNFVGDESPIYSSNYPAAGNFLVDLETTTGSVNINAVYTPKELSTQEQVRNQVMAYIEANHPETAVFMQVFAWTGGRVDTGLIGAETYTYLSSGWNVTLQYPVVPNAPYTVTADYSATTADGQASIPYRIIWTGTWQNNTITEESYVFAQ
ncbi:MAG: zinc-ribbon domain-containing protein [Candidatus Bathyarchaeota archaeon]|nr:zinc-ribbon domain-containing protein [Candidatus Bathyarchaeota archaeon]